MACCGQNEFKDVFYTERSYVLFSFFWFFFWGGEGQILIYKFVPTLTVFIAHIFPVLFTCKKLMVVRG